MRLLVYVPLLTPRIKYIFNFIFKDILKTELEFSQDLPEFIASGLPKFSYAAQPIGGTLFFKSVNLLQEHTIEEHLIQTTNFGDHQVPFPVSCGALPFDLFAASFYFLTRYEEYLSHTWDRNGTYPASSSLQYQLDMLQFPVIDGWALILKNILLKHFPDVIFEKKQFSFTPAYSLYPIPATPQGRLKRVINRLKTTLKIIPDTQKIRHTVTSVHEIITEMEKKGKVSKSKYIIPEKLVIPNSYVKLIRDNNLTDYNMYYRETPGFRAGTCTPFYWYDLQIEKQTQLLVHPVAISDTVLSFDQQQDLPAKMNELIGHVKLVNGSFYSLWHHSP